MVSFFRVPQELHEPSKKLAARVRRFFSTKKDRLSDTVPSFVVVDGMERQAATCCTNCIVPRTDLVPDESLGERKWAVLRIAMPAIDEKPWRLCPLSGDIASLPHFLHTHRRVTQLKLCRALE